MKTIVMLFVLCVCVTAQASEDSIRKLESRIERIEQRLDRLESSTNQSVRKLPNGKQRWRALQKGMTEDQVSELIGTPGKVDVYGSWFVWYWSNPSGGSVNFDGHSRTVTGWQEP